MRVRTAVRLETASQGAAAATIGGFIGSITEPPTGVEWGLLVAGCLLAGAAGYFHWEARGS